jgi:tRNA pseudouridine32 synthase/23S rRNA pseudouridine746 synthase
MLTIVLDNADFMVVNKPSGMPMHDAENGIITEAQNLFNYDKLWLVHRLDNDTSGCLILAKNKPAAAQLAQQFAQKIIQKYYIALIDNKPKKKQGMIKGDMKKARNGDWKLSNEHNNPAVTQFFSFILPNKSSSTHCARPSQRICIVKPISGKTHQIRVALKSLGSPIIGDKRYKGSESDRLYLHSYAIQFKFNNESFSATCLPHNGVLFADINNTLTEITAPWLMQWPTYKH